MEIGLLAKCEHSCSCGCQH